MQVGDKVVCIDDSIPGPLAKLFTQVPVKDTVYTIRAVYVGRGVMHTKPGAADGEIGLLLNELHNPPDHKHLGKGELGFRIERFRPMDALDATKDEAVLAELVNTVTTSQTNL